MYVGDYLSNNLGHEIINLFRDDNGRHYLYLNSSGSFSSEHEVIDIMLLVRYATENRFEIIGMARGLEIADGASDPRKRDIKEEDKDIWEKQKTYIIEKQEGIKYGGLSVLDIFNQAEQQNVFITYKAKEVKVPKNDVRLFLQYAKEQNYVGGEVQRGEEGETRTKTVVLRGHKQPKTSLKSYIYPVVKGSEEPETLRADYERVLSEIINDDELWTVEKDWQVDVHKAESLRPVSLFDICEIQNDENRLTNAMAYFMRQPEYRALWQGFFKDVMEIDLSDTFKVEREKDISHANQIIIAKEKASNGEDENSNKTDEEDTTKSDENATDENKKKKDNRLTGRIDLLVTDEDNGHIVVIENKIKSDINTNRTDKIDESQLNRYLAYVDCIDSDNKKSHHYFILAPNYNRPHISPEMEKVYKKITYEDLYNYLSRDGVREVVDKDPNFRAFRDVIFRHTLQNPNDYLYHEMMEKFYARIKELNKNS